MKLDMKKDTSELDITYVRCPDCGQESFTWDSNKHNWLCLSCGAEHDVQNIAFCECCGRPEIVYDARVYESIEPDDYNPFICLECQEYQWKLMEEETP